MSVDWGAAYPKPVLSPYEAHVAFGEQPYLEGGQAVDAFSLALGRRVNDFTPEALSVLRGDSGDCSVSDGLLRKGRRALEQLQHIQ